jgi:predicted nuclease of restriction endonuclease-like (RecB) superfamily
MKSKTTKKTISNNQKVSRQKLLKEIRTLILESRNRVYKNVNKELTLLYWQIGKRIKTSVSNTENVYGKKILATLSQVLTDEFGKGFTESAISRMIIFYTTFSNEKILATLSQELSWSHFIELINVKNNNARLYYTELTKIENWSVRQLRERIDSMLFERTAISKKPEKLIKSELKKIKQKGMISEDVVFRDSYVLDFLNLHESYSENDLETAILVHLQNFITELGTDFAFLSRQKRILIDNEDHYIDLLFYHRGLNRLVAIDLKLGKFKAGYKSQMELYLKWLEKYESRPNEELPIGLILCADKSDEIIELLMMDQNRIKVANYLTELPPIKLLKQKLAKAVKIAQKQMFEKTQQKFYLK